MLFGIILAIFTNASMAANIKIRTADLHALQKKGVRDQNAIYWLFM